MAQDSDNPLPADEYYVTYDYTTNGGESSNTAVFIDYFDYVDSYNTYVYASGPVFPVLYLKSEVKITGGNGSSGNPYQLSL